MMADYKSKELNIFSGDARNKLRVVSESNAVLESDVFKFKYGLASLDGKGDVTGNMPVYIPRLCADVGGTAVYISDWLWQDRQTIAAEQSRALAAESVLRSDSKFNFDINALAISQEVSRASFADAKHSTDIASETLAREQADSQFLTALALEENGRRAADTALSSLVASNRAAFDSHATNALQAYGHFDSRITGETNRATAAEVQEAKARQDADTLHSANISATQNQIMDESNRAQTVEVGLQAQITNLLANTDAVALNSLSELVADYRLNGSSVSGSVSALTDRVAYLEGVIVMLVARSV
jgi:hypothetical protein